MQWYNPPPAWEERGDTLVVTAGPRTDFWRKTHYGFVRDSGHFFYQEVAGDFQCDVVVRGAYASLYDQAGLMVRADETTWLKTGIEFVEGAQYASAVVTRDFSDWSVVPLAGSPPAIWLRLRRARETVEVSYSLDGDRYAMLRLAYLTLAERVQVGPMCAAPDGDGFEVSFEGLVVRPA